MWKLPRTPEDASEYLPHLQVRLLFLAFVCFDVDNSWKLFMVLLSGFSCAIHQFRRRGVKQMIKAYLWYLCPQLHIQLFTNAADDTTMKLYRWKIISESWEWIASFECRKWLTWGTEVVRPAFVWWIYMYIITRQPWTQSHFVENSPKISHIEACNCSLPVFDIEYLDKNRIDHLCLVVKHARAINICQNESSLSQNSLLFICHLGIILPIVHSWSRQHNLKEGTWCIWSEWILFW